MIQDLNMTLDTLLKRELPPALADQVTISFVTPDEQFPPSSVTLPAIDLFLYDIRENVELRSNEIYVERHSNGMATRTRAPVRVDFSYLVTAWASDTTPDPSQDEHRLLGETMKVLLRHRTIPADVLQGELAGQEPPLPTSSLQPSQLQGIGDFWQAIGSKPKVTLNYCVTVSVDVAAPEDVQLVTDTVFKIRLERETAP